MAGPKTLDDEMNDEDLLELKCSGCGFSYVATKRQAVRRYGARACIVIVNLSSVCPKCRGKATVWARLMQGANRGPPGPETTKAAAPSEGDGGLIISLTSPI